MYKICFINANHIDIIGSVLFSISEMLQRQVQNVLRKGAIQFSKVKQVIFVTMNSDNNVGIKIITMAGGDA